MAIRVSSCRDRGDYKHGWQLDREWEAKEKAKKEAMARLEKMERELGENGEASHPEDEDDGEDETPTACAICGSTWADAKIPWLPSASTTSASTAR